MPDVPLSPAVPLVPLTPEVPAVPLEPDEPLVPLGPGAPDNEISQSAYVPDPVVDVIFTSSAPVPGLYDVTVPSILFVASKATIMVCPVLNARPVSTVNDFVPVPIVLLVLDVVVYRSPDRPAVPAVPDVPACPLVPDVPPVPEVPVNPDEPLEPDVPDVPDDPEVPEEPDVPAGPVLLSANNTLSLLLSVVDTP